MKRDCERDENNERDENFRLFRYFRLFRNLSSFLPVSMKKIKIAITIFALLVIVACRHSSNHKTIIAVIPKGVSHSFWQTVKAGADAAGKDLNVGIDWKGL